MLYFVTNTGAEIQWHVGNTVPEIFQPKRAKEHWPSGGEKVQLDVNFVVEVQADFTELDYIRAKFKNLPDCPENQTMRWYGETARFIHANLE